MIKVFTVSDIHGHYHVLKDALKAAGYDEKETSHHLLVLGDLFDRGTESDLVFSYLKRLYDEKKATIILGNHDYFLLEFFNKQDDRTVFNIKHNGFDLTLTAFSDQTVTVDSDFDAIRATMMRRVPTLKPFLEQLPLFIETRNYVFTHGGIDGSKTDYDEISKKDFVWQYQYDLDPPKDKTAVVGHMRTAHIRLKEDPHLKLTKDNLNLFKPLYKPQKVFIDGFVEFSKHINVVVFEIDEISFKDAFNQ